MKQRVVINGQHSEWSNIVAGVPQGSVLGPLLFVVYINDIVTNIRGNIKLFADDTALYVDVDRTEEGEAILNADLESVRMWAKQWLVDFNSKKTVAMKVSLKTKPNPNPKLNLNDSQLQIVSSHKHLGLRFSSKLQWRDHIKCIADTANSRLVMLKRLRTRLDRRTLEILYKSFIRPTLEYGSIVWDNCDEESKNMLDKIELEAARVVSRRIKGTHHQALYDEVGWETLRSRREQHKLLLYH